jgi:hypothetical protein
MRIVSKHYQLFYHYAITAVSIILFRLGKCSACSSLGDGTAVGVPRCGPENGRRHSMRVKRHVSFGTFWFPIAFECQTHVCSTVSTWNGSYACSTRAHCVPKHDTHCWIESFYSDQWFLHCNDGHEFGVSHPPPPGRNVRFKWFLTTRITPSGKRGRSVRGSDRIDRTSWRWCTTAAVVADRQRYATQGRWCRMAKGVRDRTTGADSKRFSAGNGARLCPVVATSAVHRNTKNSSVREIIRKHLYFFLTDIPYIWLSNAV